MNRTWKDEKGNLYIARIYGHQDNPKATIKFYSHNVKDLSQAGVHEVLYIGRENDSLYEAAEKLAKRAKQFGCPVEKADEIMDIGINRYEDGQIP